MRGQLLTFPANVGAALESPASRSALRYGCGEDRGTKAPPHLVEIGRGPLLPFQLQHHPLDVAIFGVSARAGEDFPAGRPNARSGSTPGARPSHSSRAASPCRGRSCFVLKAPNRNLPRGRVGRWKGREKSCPPASAPNRPRRCRRSGWKSCPPETAATAKCRRSPDTRFRRRDRSFARPEWRAVRLAAAPRGEHRPALCDSRIAGDRTRCAYKRSCGLAENRSAPAAVHRPGDARSAAGA